MADNIGYVDGEISNAPGVIVQPQNVQIVVIDGDDTGDEAHPELPSSIRPNVDENRANDDASENERTPGRKRRKRCCENNRFSLS